jgi:deazaflavin-dependent oxidoreductase (nitroreductase family)
MARTYKLGPVRKGFNSVFKKVLGAGIPTPGLAVLTTRGRKTGKEHSTPVQLIEQDNDRYLVAAYGVVPWVHNARAAGTVELARGHDSGGYSIEELSPERAAPILKKYVKRAPIVLPYFDAKLTSPVEEFEADVPNHPVFKLHPINEEREPRTPDR